MAEEQIKHEVGSGNVFADLGHPDAEEKLEKARLVYSILKIINDKGLTQAKAAEILGIQQPRISDLVRGKWYDFSVERLIRLSRLIGNDVQIVINGEVQQRNKELIST